MAIDTSMYSQLRAPQIESPGEAMGKAITLKSMLNKSDAEDKAIADQKMLSDLYKKNTVVGEDGKASLDQKSILSDLYKASPQLAMKKEKEFTEKNRADEAYEFENQMKKTDLAKNLAWSIHDEGSYQQARIQAQKFGLPTDQMPPNFDPAFVEKMKMTTMNASEQMAQAWKEKNFGMDEKRLSLAQRDQDRNYALRKEELGIKRLAAAAKKNKEGKLSSTEAKQKGLYELGVDAEKQFRKAVSDPDNYDPTQTGQVIDNSEWAPNWMKNEKAIEAQAAQANWVEAFLRDASGAAIPPSERMAYAEDFFPAPGDTPQVVENKRQLRERKMENARIGAGGDRTTQQASFDQGAEDSQRRRSRIAELRAKMNQTASK